MLFARIYRRIGVSSLISLRKCADIKRTASNVVHNHVLPRKNRPLALKMRAREMKRFSMRILVLLLLPFLLANAAPSGVSGSSALALSALVAANSPTLSTEQKQMLAALFNGDLNQRSPAGKKIMVHAESIICRAGDVDISRHSCDLNFGKQQVSLDGRAAHELYATLIEAGVPSDGAAGTIYESLFHLTCAIDVDALKQRSGGGADCKFESGTGISQ